MAIEDQQIRFPYQCCICHTTKMKFMQEEPTEACYVPFYDELGYLHDHDLNEGSTKCVCENGHETQQAYIAACSCGWTSQQPDNTTRASSKLDLFD